MSVDGRLAILVACSVIRSLTHYWGKTSILLCPNQFMGMCPEREIYFWNQTSHHELIPSRLRFDWLDSLIYRLWQAEFYVWISRWCWSPWSENRTGLFFFVLRCGLYALFIVCIFINEWLPQWTYYWQGPLPFLLGLALAPPCIKYFSSILARFKAIRNTTGSTKHMIGEASARYTSSKERKRPA